MATRVFRLPDLGEGLEEAEVVQWLVAEGDQVELNQPLVEVNTAKALVEIPSPWAGVVNGSMRRPARSSRWARPLVSVRVDDARRGGARRPRPGAGRLRRGRVADDAPPAAVATPTGDAGAPTAAATPPCAGWRRSSASTSPR